MIAFFIDFVGAAGLREAEGVLSFVGCVDGDEISVGVDYVILGVVQVAAGVFTVATVISSERRIWGAQ